MEAAESGTARREEEESRGLTAAASRGIGEEAVKLPLRPLGQFAGRCERPLPIRMEHWRSRRGGLMALRPRCERGKKV